MYPSYLKNYIIRESQTSVEAFLMLEKQKYFGISPILAVLDESDKYLGIITTGALSGIIMHHDDPMQLTAGDVCNRKACTLEQSSSNRIEAMEVFADYDKIWAMPVIDKKKHLADIIFRQQVFYRDFYIGANKFMSLPRLRYGSKIFSAAQLAKNLGYDSFSVIEFGVAGGNGLVACEFHIKEIARLFDIKIELYGFDTGEGLPESSNPYDLPWIWSKGYYNMDIKKLKDRLQFAQLIIGDLRETAGSFMETANFAPIGVMLIDVDLYSSTVPILNMLRYSPSKFLPRVHMYFDDIFSYTEFAGENLAVDEFNASSNDVKISINMGSNLEEIEKDLSVRNRCAHFLSHDKYNTSISDFSDLNLKQLPLI